MKKTFIWGAFCQKAGVFLPNYPKGKYEVEFIDFVQFLYFYLLLVFSVKTPTRVGFYFFAPILAQASREKKPTLFGFFSQKKENQGFSKKAN